MPGENGNLFRISELLQKRSSYESEKPFKIAYQMISTLWRHFENRGGQRYNSGPNHAEI